MAGGVPAFQDHQQLELGGDDFLLELDQFYIKFMGCFFISFFFIMTALVHIY